MESPKVTEKNQSTEAGESPKVTDKKTGKAEKKEKKPVKDEDGSTPSASELDEKGSGSDDGNAVTNTKTNEKKANTNENIVKEGVDEKSEEVRSPDDVEETPTKKPYDGKNKNRGLSLFKKK